MCKSTAKPQLVRTGSKSYSNKAFLFLFLWVLVCNVRWFWFSTSLPLGMELLLILSSTFSLSNFCTGSINYCQLMHNMWKVNIQYCTLLVCSAAGSEYQIIASPCFVQQSHSLWVHQCNSKANIMISGLSDMKFCFKQVAQMPWCPGWKRRGHPTGCHWTFLILWIRKQLDEGFWF